MDKFGRFDGVVVGGYVDIAIEDYYTKVHIETEKIALRSGMTCNLKAESCIDYDGSQFFWQLPNQDASNQVNIQF